jgi:hypothetical protein
MRHPWSHLDLWTEAWLGVLIVHLLVVIRLRPGKDADTDTDTNER